MHESPEGHYFFLAMKLQSSALYEPGGLRLSLLFWW